MAENNSQTLGNPYRNNKVEEDEKELEELEAQRSGESQDDNEPNPDNHEDPEDPEERTWKKRYSDLRRHLQNIQDKYENRIQELERQVSQTTQEQMQLPESEEQLEQWMQEYPDVARKIEAIAQKKADERVQTLEQRQGQIEERERKAARRQAEAELMRLHPDFGEIRQSEDFHTWAETQPKWVQDALYNNETDAQAASRAIDLYKADRGLTQSSNKSRTQQRDASQDVNARSERQQPTTSKGKVWKESEIANLTPRQVEENMEEIEKARREGRVEMDISGASR